jgi:hypothetical protein
MSIQRSGKGFEFRVSGCRLKLLFSATSHELRTIRYEL